VETVEAVIEQLKSLAQPENLAGMARFGIATEQVLGIPLPALRNLAKQYRRNHPLALALWDTGIHEARILAALVDDPSQVTEEQMEAWVRDFNSWDLCDQCCGNLFDKTPLAYDKAIEWSHREEEFVKRAGFALMAWLAVHDKNADDDRFRAFFPHLEQGAADERNFVKKAVNWALRQIGKRNRTLNREAVNTARRIQQQDTRSARWIAAHTFRELTSPKVQERLHRREAK
jgi:3-methyladenine DNA glycosylase AlkD